MKQVCLLIIDVQKGFDEVDFWGERNNPNAEKNMQTLLNAWRNKNLPVVHIQHHSLNENAPLHPSKLGYQLKSGFEPIESEPFYIKNVNSAFIGTTLKEDLERAGIQDLVIIGLTTNHCVSTTARMAANYGFNVHVVHDATAAFATTSYNGKHFSAEEVHESALAHLNEEFAKIVSTNEALMKWGNPAGKMIQ